MTEPSLREGLMTTRAIRRYSDAPVTTAQLNDALFLATRAPSGSNRQPFRFVVLRDEPAARPVRELLADGAAQLWEAKRSRDEFPAELANSPTGRMLASMDAYVAGMAKVPVIVLACMIRYREPTPTEGASIYPAVQNLLLGARSVGLGSAITMFHQAREAEIRSALGLPDDTFIAATVTLGHPAGSHGPVRRKPLSELVYEARWGQPASWAADPEGTRFTGGPQS